MERKSTYSLLGIAIMAVLWSGCYFGYNDNAKRNKEFGPNMYHSMPLEPYSQTTGDPVSFTYGVDEGEYLNDIFSNGLNAQAAPAGTVPRDSWYRADMYAPYPYSNTVEGYDSATQYLRSPLADTEEGGADCTEQSFNNGKRIYDTFCVMCHGPNGEGQGILVTKGAYAGVPAYSTRPDLTEGQMFHSITMGKGIMGSYASQITPRERWEVICYISQFLDAAEDVAAN